MLVGQLDSGQSYAIRCRISITCEDTERLCCEALLNTDYRVFSGPEELCRKRRGLLYRRLSFNRLILSSAVATAHTRFADEGVRLDFNSNGPCVSEEFEYAPREDDRTVEQPK